MQDASIVLHHPHRPPPISLIFSHTNHPHHNTTELIHRHPASLKTLAIALYKLLLHVLTTGQSDLTLVTTLQDADLLMRAIGARVCICVGRVWVGVVDKHTHTRRRYTHTSPCPPTNLTHIHTTTITTTPPPQKHTHTIRGGELFGVDRVAPRGLAEADGHLLQPRPPRPSQSRPGLPRLAPPPHVPQDRCARRVVGVILRL